MSYKVKTKAIFIVSGLFLILALYFSAVILHVPKTENTQTIDYSEKLSGFPIGTTAQIEYITPQKFTLNTLSILDNIPVTSLIQKNILNETKQYSVNFIMAAPDDTFLDIKMGINKEANYFDTKISGLPQESKVSLSSQKQNYYTNVPVDWTGRLAFNVKNAYDLTGTEICITIKQAEQLNSYVVCHNVVQNFERQVAL